MFGRGLLFLIVLCAAVGIPYFLSAPDSEVGTRLHGWKDSLLAHRPAWPGGMDSPIATATPLPEYSSFHTPLPHQRYPASRGAYPATGYGGGVASQQATPWLPVGATGNGGSWGGVPPQRGHTPVNVAALFRFDITPDWVMQNWPRVSSQLSEFTYAGLRVPLVTGTGIHDLAGSLTYFFDEQRKLQRIAFHGTTGDPGQLANLVQQQFGLQPGNSIGGLYYDRESNNQIDSVLRITNAPWSTASQPHRRYRVAMELNREGEAATLSRRMQTILDDERNLRSFRELQGTSSKDALP